MRLLTALIVSLLCVPSALRGQAACPTPWPLEEALRIGSPESTDLVASVLDLAIGPDSALYVAQAMVPSVTVFSLDGRVLRRIGRAGQGPGDIQLAARAVGWIGDTLWVADFNRIQLFTSDEHRPEQVIQFSLGVPEEGSSLTPGRMLADGTLVGRRRTTDGQAWSSRGENPGLALRRLSRSGEVLDTITTIEWPGNAVEHERDARLFPGQHPLRDLPPIGLGEYLAAVTPNGSAVVQIGKVHEDATPPTFDLLVISIRGDTLLHRSVEYEPREVTRVMERRLADEYAGWRAGDYTQGSELTETTRARTRRAARGVFWMPEHLPPVRQVVAGTDGTIWLLREMREDRVDIWEVYDSDGALEGTVEIGHGRSSLVPWDPRLAVALASRDEVWGATYGDFGIPYIHRYLIDRTCAP
ncbi:MAG: hypothetical protein OXI39_08510 [Gemmatimonadota bacterium]|uniref:hypothetical protein n=1 Tax=Candidatus Palauibacter scopulicola TaxID=3056741 RepID=UPI00239F9B2C|nr:hypothetical protein [Candidatus Palauibacter scopulicola]MDE2663032.1 hypothetical protein [Candidatus Palauibacter scopulicola]